MIELCELGFRAGSRWLVDGISFRVDPGEVVALIGPNGAGKSTLLRLISGELRPARGELRWGGRPLSSLSGRELARQRSVLGQHTRIDFPIEAGEVVALGRAPHGDSRSTARSMARDAMRRTDTLHLARRIAPTLSGGELQRVQAARALVQIAGCSGFAALLLDEPVSALDPCHQHQILRLATEEAERGAAVLCVLHELNLVARYATRVVALDQGRVIKDGRPADVLRPSLLARLFRIDAEVRTFPEFSWPLIITRGPCGASASVTDPTSPETSP